MLAKDDLEKLAQLRLDDGLLLFDHGRTTSAYYLIGYSIELALKASIAKQFKANVIPDKSFVNTIYTHKFETLLNSAGLKSAFDADAKIDPSLAANWAIANQWSEESRYKFSGALQVMSLVTAIADPHHGVFQWIKKSW